MTQAPEAEKDVPADTQTVARALYEASRTRTLLRPPSNTFPSFGVAQGYEVQRRLRDLHVAEGTTCVGAKLGLTSRAKQLQMGVDTIVYGFLTEAMRLDIGEPLAVASLAQPRVEPEIAFLIGRPLFGRHITTADVVAATEAVCPAIEVLDSRYRDYRFTAADVVADNASSGRFIAGVPMTPTDALDLRLLGCVFERDGELIGTAAGAAALGHPASSVTALVRALADHDEGLNPGDVVLSGGLTAAVPVAAGNTFTVRFDRLGTLDLRCV